MTLEQIEGVNPVVEALRAGRPLTRIFVARDLHRPAVDRLVALARERGVPLQEVSRERLSQLARSRAHQGVVALAAARDYADLGEVLDRATVPFLVALDELQDPQNLGAIIRTADAVGADGVIVPARRSAGLSPSVLKASAGAAEHVSVVRVTNLVGTLKFLQERGLWVVGADAAGDRCYWEADFRDPLTLVIGGEHRGLRRLVRETCDHVLRIPMAGKLDSLNAAAAAAVFMFEVARQRTARVLDLSNRRTL
ncbi:MAG: 23S rRNA (guanosine(2251)-2'-O)-methyltransferase RlmB [bacterium]|nr:23S rRNA (guanosine(2251)-2'-O)-methyltransferase RlmB [bacterium]